MVNDTIHKDVEKNSERGQASVIRDAGLCGCQETQNIVCEYPKQQGERQTEMLKLKIT